MKSIESRGWDDKRLKVSKKDRIEYETTGHGIGLNKTGLDRTGWVVKQIKIGR